MITQPLGQHKQNRLLSTIFFWKFIPVLLLPGRRFFRVSERQKLLAILRITRNYKSFLYENLTLHFSPPTLQDNDTSICEYCCVQLVLCLNQCDRLIKLRSFSNRQFVDDGVHLASVFGASVFHLPWLFQQRSLTSLFATSVASPLLSECN